MELSPLEAQDEINVAVVVPPGPPPPGPPPKVIQCYDPATFQSLGEAKVRGPGPRDMTVPDYGIIV